jgi:RimJ/RimL family protein N-acetyltransferase
VAAAGPVPIEFPIGGIVDGDIRIRLRSDADIPAIVAACQDPEIPRWTRVPFDYDIEAARDWSIQAATEQADGNALSVLITDADDDSLLGSIGIVLIDWAESRCDIAYWIAAQARGRGVATRAVRALCRWTFENLPMERISICAEPENAASRRVAENAGFTFEGILRSWHVNKGRRADCAMYSLLRNEPT